MTVAVLLFAIGVVVFLSLGLVGVGLIIGPIVCLSAIYLGIKALFLGDKHQRVWKCVSCGFIANRA